MTGSNKPKPNAAIFILSGLFAGVLLGVGIALMIQNRSLQKHSSRLHSDSDTLQTLSEEFSESNTRRGRTMTDTVAATGEAGEESGEPDTLDPSDTLLYISTADSVSLFSGDGQDIVLRDELIAVKRTKLIADSESTTRKQGDSIADSLLTTLTGVKPPDGLFPEYRLEFWRNPLNYRGYKVIKDRIILFGLSPEQAYQLTHANNQLLLVAPKAKYILKESAEYQALIPRK